MKAIFQSANDLISQVSGRRLVPFSAVFKHRIFLYKYFSTVQKISRAILRDVPRAAEFQQIKDFSSNTPYFIFQSPTSREPQKCTRLRGYPCMSTRRCPISISDKIDDRTNYSRPCVSPSQSGPDRAPAAEIATEIRNEIARITLRFSADKDRSRAVSLVPRRFFSNIRFISRSRCNLIKLDTFIAFG